MMLTVAPEFLPNSAEGLLAMTWYSCTASTLGTSSTVPPHGPLFTLAPSTLALLPVCRTPFAVTPMPCSAVRKSAVLGMPLMPGCSAASASTLRPMSGRSLIFFCSTTAEISAFSVWMSGATARTSIASDSPPGVEREVDAEGRAHREDDLVLARRPEPLELRGDFVAAGVEAEDAIEAGFVGDRRPGDAGVDVGDGDGDAGHDGLAGVGDGALNGSELLLGVAGSREHQEEGDREAECQGTSAHVFPS